jgi:hypothetical protein
MKTPSDWKFKSNDLVTLLSTSKQNCCMVRSLWKTHHKFQNVHIHVREHKQPPLKSKPKFLILNIPVPAIFRFIITEKKTKHTHTHIYTVINI